MTDYLGDIALRTWVNLNPSPQWANRTIEQYRGLPFGVWLHKSRPRRQRTLTGNLSSASEGVLTLLCRQIGVYSDPPQRTDEQLQSKLLQKLPLDLRLMIYEMVIGGMLIQLSAYDSRSPITHQCSSDLSARRSSTDKQIDPAAAVRLLPLLLTCRQIYSEAIDLLYSANTFDFTQNFVAFAFLTQIVPAHRIKCIRHLRIHMRIPRHPALNSRTTRDWADLWAFFATEMAGLQSLKLELQMLPPTEDQIRLTDDAQALSWIRPIVEMAVTADRRRRCEVQLEIQHTPHRPAEIYRDARRALPTAKNDQVLRLACARLHERIRLSLDTIDSGA